jgi:hypothetical protein
MMNLNSQTKTFCTVAAVLLLIYFLYNRRDTPVHNIGALDTKTDSFTADDSNNVLPENEEVSEEGSHSEDSSVQQAGTNANMSTDDELGDKKVDYKNIPISKDDMVKYFPQRDYAPPESDWLAQKFNSRNKSRRGFKKSSFSGSKRGNLGPSEWDDYFDDNNNVITNAQSGDNANFMPIDETNGGFAVFKTKGRATCGSNQNCEPEDLFDVDKYLPQEVNDDWFEVQPEPISVKNRHLINITKPIGVNTIGTSLKNASWDIRGTPACPKYIVSPWSQSSIEPDYNLKPLL